VPTDRLRRLRDELTFVRSDLPSPVLFIPHATKVVISRFSNPGPRVQGALLSVGLQPPKRAALGAPWPQRQNPPQFPAASAVVSTKPAITSPSDAATASSTAASAAALDRAAGQGR
jgi:hypothetical protein